MARAAAGDEGAFRALYRAHVLPVYWIAHGILGSVVDAEDVAQETFVVAWRKLPGLELVGASVLPWLATICRFQAANRLRQRRRDQAHTTDAADDHIPATVSVEEQVITAALAERITAEIGTLSALDQEVFRLCATEGYAYQAAADELGISHGVVRKSSLTSAHATARRCGRSERRMNDLTHTDDVPELPALSQASIDRIEDAVFADIAHDRASQHVPVRKKSRRRGWLTGVGIAAAFVAGILITPPLLNTVGVSTAEGGGSVVGLADRSSSDMAVPEIASDAPSSIAGVETESADREIIAAAQATVRVHEISPRRSVPSPHSQSHTTAMLSTHASGEPTGTDTTVPGRPAGGYGWISIRVPSADLTDVIDGLSDTGEVVSSSLSKQDVTSTAIDLRAQVESSSASVARLTELMSQSGSVSELIEAEVALTDRQAQLEVLRAAARRARRPGRDVLAAGAAFP